MKYTTDEIEQLIVSKLKKTGFSKDDAYTIARVFIAAELRNDPGHGLSYVDKIVNEVKNNKLDPKKAITPIVDNKATVVLDCEKAAGPVAVLKGIDIAISKAKEYGVGISLLRKTHHLFSLSYYIRYAAEKGMIILLTTSSQPAICAPGGKQKLFGTNPIGFGAPSNGQPLVIDMASTVVARGNIKEAQKLGKKIPMTWAYDKDGKPTDDPTIALEGSLQPIGNYKGFLLAWIVDILSSVLSGSAYSKYIFGTSMHAKAESKDVGYKGDFIMILDPSKFIDGKEFKIRMSKIYSFIEDDGGYIPGQNASKKKEIEVSDDVIKSLKE